MVIDRKSVYNGFYHGWNIDNVQLWGFEYEFNVTFNHLNIFGNYAYKANDVIEDNPAKLVGFWVELPPKHNINLSFRYKVTDDVSLSWDQRFVGRRSSERGFILDSYTTSDVGLQYSFYENKAKVNFYVNNLFGENYQDLYGWAMPRQTFGMTLKYTFF